MTVIPREAFIRMKAVSILKRYKVERPPVPLYNIVKSEGIEVLYLFDGPDLGPGVTIRKPDGKYKICINISGCEKQDNWNLAIQYGHISLGHFRLFTVDTLTSDKLKPEERQTLNRESEIFAQEILAPDYLLRPLVKKRKRGAVERYVSDPR